MSTGARYLSNRVATVSPGNVAVDRYQWLDLKSAEPNLGTSGNGYVLTSNVTGARIWTTNVNVSSVTGGNITSLGNIVTTNGLFWANGVAFASSTYNNSNVADFLLNSFGSNSIVTTGNIAASNIIVSNIYPSLTTTANINLIGNVIVSGPILAVPAGPGGAGPGGEPAGAIRYNSTSSSLEFYNGTQWVSVVNAIDNQIITGDNSNTVFTLTHSALATSILVSINGTIQQPDIAYSVSGNQITFVEIPLSSDIIDVRYLALLLQPAITTINAGATIIVSTANTIIDSFSTTVFRSAKYTISSTSSTDAHIADVSLVQIGGIVRINTSSNVNTGSNTITYYANVSGATVNLMALGTISSNIKIQTSYFST